VPAIKVPRLLLLALLYPIGLAAQVPAEPSATPHETTDPELKKRTIDVSVTPNTAAKIPPTLGVRATVMLKKFVGVQAIYETVPGTLIDQARDFPEEWGQGWDGFGQRLGSRYGQFVLSESIEFAVSAVRHEDPRYIYSKRTRIWDRTEDAIVGTWLVRKDNSSQRTLALGRIAGVFGSWGIATRWEPDPERDVARYFRHCGFSMATKTGINVAREFWPDIRRKVFHRP
jgi:hypothetical protein